MNEQKQKHECCCRVGKGEKKQCCNANSNECYCDKKNNNESEE